MAYQSVLEIEEEIDSIYNALDTSKEDILVYVKDKEGNLQVVQSVVLRETSLGYPVIVLEL